MEVMIDIETLGTRPSSSILSIGAVLFQGHEIGKEFYSRVALPNMPVVEARTLIWWSKQPGFQKLLEGEAVSLRVALQALANFIGEDARVWANGIAFDIPILENAYARVNLPVPWSYWNVRDYRTLAKLKGVPTEIEFEGEKHNALDDARYQTRCLISIRKNHAF